MGRNTFQGTKRTYLRTLAFYYLSVWPILFKNEIDYVSYADDSTPYVTVDNNEGVINSLENVSVKLFKWFTDNQVKAKKDKCHLFISGSENITINVDGNITGKSICEKLLGVNIDYKLKLNEHLDSILKKAGRK